jgi:hypothetical protein
MPGGDRTGPNGRGSMTGRARGVCAGYSDPGSLNAGGGRPVGGGRSCGRGRRWRFSASPQISMLRQQAHQLEETLADLRVRIRGFESSTQGTKSAQANDDQ